MDKGVRITVEYGGLTGETHIDPELVGVYVNETSQWQYYASRGVLNEAREHRLAAEEILFQLGRQVKDLMVDVQLNKK